MSYSIRFSKLSAYYQGEGYSFSWPDKLSQCGRDMLKGILCSYNHTYSRLEATGLNQIELSDGIYFFLFEEGAVLFRVGGYKSDVCFSAALIGLFFEHDYVPTAWFLIDRLTQVVMSDGYYSLDDATASEEDIDRLCSEYKPGYIGINPNGETDLFSFAIAPIDPCLRNVEFTSNVGSSRTISPQLGGRSNRTVESILAIKSISPHILVDDRYKSAILERNQEDKRGFFKRPDPTQRPWGIRLKSDNYEGVFRELESIEDAKLVSFSTLVSEVDGITGRQRNRGYASERRKAICMDK